VRVKAQKQNKQDVDLKLKLLKIDRKRLKKYFENRVRIARDVERREDRDVKAESKGNISCLNQKDREFVSILNGNHLMFNPVQAYLRVTVINSLPYPVLISAVDPGGSTSGDIAELPGGCEITLSRSIRGFTETYNTNGIGYRYKARAIDAVNYKGFAYSNPYFLYSGNNFSQRGTDIWVISNFQTQ